MRACSRKIAYIALEQARKVLAAAAQAQMMTCASLVVDVRLAMLVIATDCGNQSLADSRMTMRSLWIGNGVTGIDSTMLPTPLLILYSDRIVMRLSANDWLLQSVAMTSNAKRTIKSEAHVNICGVGRSGH